MADPMWSGGAMQFADWAPWIWSVMGDWAKAPFYPTDPPRTPGAFYDSVSPICDFPLLGTAYAPFITQYALYYSQEWDANPPGSYTSSSNPPSSDEDTSLAAKLDLLTLQVAALHSKVGTVVETDTLASLLYYVASRVGGGEAPPPLATSGDTARILAALYYIAEMVVVPAWAVDNSEVLAAITASKESIKGPHDTSNSSLWDGMFDATWGLQRTINDNTNAAQTAIESAIAGAVGPVGEDTDAIIALLGEGIQAEGGGNFYPGAADVTFGDAVPVNGLAVITGPMDGVVYSITQPVSGQSHQQTGDVHRYKGIGWLAFVSDNGQAEGRQSLEMSPGLAKPMSMAQAASCAVFAKPGTLLTVTPYVRN